MSSGFFQAPGTNYSVGDEPTLAQRLNKLGKDLKLHLIGLSGYRTPARSVAVGGFADDPHTKGKASDTPGVENVPESTLEKYGLTRPFGGASEADHIQLFGKSTRGRVKGGRISTLADLWIQAGGKKNLAPMMAAIAEAESSGRVDAVGGPNNDGTYDYGLWQINSSHSQYDANKLVSDPLYNARAAVAIENSQGLGAWSTYSSGAYQNFLGTGKSYAPTFGRTRPGGDNQDTVTQSDWASYTEDSTGSIDGGTTQNASFELSGPGGIGIPIPNPFDAFNSAGKVIKDTTKFLQWVAWMLNPRHILQAVEFVSGFILMMAGLHTFIRVQSGEDRPLSGSGPVKLATEAAELTAAGRIVRTAKGTRAGKREAKLRERRKQRIDAHKRASKKTVSKERMKANEREMNRKYGGVPF